MGRLHGGLRGRARASARTEYAPWYVVPADRKWFRNWVISDILAKTVDRLDMKYPKPKQDLSKVTIE